jgi:hypothetical protein
LEGFFYYLPGPGFLYLVITIQIITPTIMIDGTRHMMSDRPRFFKPEKTVTPPNITNRTIKPIMALRLLSWQISHIMKASKGNTNTKKKIKEGVLKLIIDL